MRTDVRRAVAEALGTFFLVLIGPGAAMVNAYTEGTVGHAGVALAFAFVVVAMIYAAVTIAFWTVRRFPGRGVLPYVVAQCAGAAAASFTLGAVLGPVWSYGATLPAVGVGRSVLLEWLLSFVLMLVIMAVVTDERVASGIAGIEVGLTVGFCAMMGGPLTGASMNPARSLGPAVAGARDQDRVVYCSRCARLRTGCQRSPRIHLQRFRGSLGLPGSTQLRVQHSPPCAERTTRGLIPAGMVSRSRHVPPLHAAAPISRNPS